MAWRAASKITLPTMDRVVMREWLGRQRGQATPEQIYEGGYEQARVLHTEYAARPSGVGGPVVLGFGAVVVFLGLLGVPGGVQWITGRYRP